MNKWFTTLERKETDSAKWQGAHAKAKRDDVLAFSVADSDYETAPAIKAALMKRVAHGAFGYARPGHAYREAVVSWSRRRYNLTIEPEWVEPAPKVLNALSVIIDVFTQPGDGVLIQTPVYHVFDPVIRQNRRRVIEHELACNAGNYSIDFDRLDNDLKDASMFILCSPHNPVGRVWKESELARIVSLCKKHDVYLISDEIHADLVMKGHRFISCGAHFDAHDKLILVSAPSKTFNVAGLQIAHTIIKHAPTRKRLMTAYQRLHLTGPNVLALTAIEAAYTEGDAWVDAQNQHVEANYQMLKTRWESLSDTARITPLEGTYLAWLDVSFTGYDGETFCQRLATQHGVVLSHGSAFGRQSTAFVRMNLACSKAQLTKGIKRIETFVSDAASTKK